MSWCNAGLAQRAAEATFAAHAENHYMFTGQVCERSLFSAAATKRLVKTGLYSVVVLYEGDLRTTYVVKKRKDADA